MTSEWIRNIHIDTRYESYKDFFSDDWGHRIDAIVRDASKLRLFALDLLADWRGAAYAVSFPTVMVEHFRSFAEGYVNESSPSTGILRFSEVVLTKLSRELPDLSAHPQLKRDLHKRIVCLSAEILDAHSQVKLEFPSEQIWEQYLGDHVYQITIWSLLRICYVAVYNAYDNFIHRCTSTAHTSEDVRTSNNDFKRKLCDAFGPAVTQQCWTNAAIRRARRTRHALAHAGGRETDDLRRESHNFAVHDGVIHIMPEDIKELYSTLKDAVLVLAETAKGKPAFR